MEEILQAQQPTIPAGTQPLSDLSYWQQYCEAFNQTKGDWDKRDGFNCDYCKNRGHLLVVRDDTPVSRDCPECMSIRKSIWQLKKSGLADKTFDSFTASEEWRQKLLGIVRKYVDENSGKWLFIGGQSGAGKTHLCTAALREFIFRYHEEALLFEWAEKAKELKRCVNDPDYDIKINLYKNVPVLYIDDFLKVKKGEKPTAADINLAFELIDYRYRKSLITIISSEFSVNDIISFDEALGGRIKFKAKEYALHIGRDTNKNYRLKD